MIQHKKMDVICIGAIALAFVIAALLWLGAQAGIFPSASHPEYAVRLFDDGKVHTIDLQIDDWDAFVAGAQEKEYVPCTVTIDGAVFHQVGLRAKGSNSLKLIGEYGLSRYSMKLEFDHYIDGGNYYGLDALSLDTSFQDNSYLKTYLVYDMMAFMGVPAPLCSYTWVTVNGVDWGLFLAIEEPEDAFLRRNFGTDPGNLYKPDYQSLSAENADLALRYLGDDPKHYPNIFENAKTKTTKADQQRLIAALKVLSTGENLNTAVNVDEVLRYFTVQVFVMNWDSYLGRTGHNYFLYEKDGILSILPWDYNLAFGTYALGMTNPIRDPNVLINYPVDTPAEGQVMLNRPLYHNMMKNNEYFTQYHQYFDQFLSRYFENNRFLTVLRQTEQLIAPYVQKDPTAFCSFADHQLAVDTLEQVCLLRAQSVRGQLAGEIPATILGQQENPGTGVDASTVQMETMGDFDDLESAKERQDAAKRRVQESR